MANEIKIVRETGKTLYAIVWRANDLYVWDTSGTPAFEAPGTWDDARVGNCDIALTEVAGTGWYQASMPAIGTTPTRLFIRFFEQIGASPDTTDPESGDGLDFVWDGWQESDPLLWDRAAKKACNESVSTKTSNSVTTIAIRNDGDTAAALEYTLTKSGDTITRSTLEAP